MKTYDDDTTENAILVERLTRGRPVRSLYVGRGLYEADDVPLLSLDLAPSPHRFSEPQHR